MVSTRNHLSKVRQGPPAGPAAQFITDFAGLVTAVDRLMVDIGSAIETEQSLVKPNGNANSVTLTGTISSLRDHAQSFLKSVRHFELMLDRIPVPFMELDGKARILRANEECAEMLNGSAAPLSGKSLFNFVVGSDAKRLQEYLAIARQTNKPCVVHTAVEHRGICYPVELRVRRQLLRNEVGYVAVVECAEQWRNTNEAKDRPRNGTPPPIDELIVDLSHAQNLKSVGDTVANYCAKAFGSPAGMVLVQQDSDLQLVSHWLLKQIPEKRVLDEFRKNGPVARVLRTGKPIFWPNKHTPHSNLGRYLYRLLRQTRGQNITFLPIGAQDRCTVGVLAIALPPTKEFGPIVYDELAQLGRVVSGCIIRAQAYDEAIAARAKAENGIKSKDEFLSILSHELKNPMMPILSWAVALSSGTLPADKLNLALEGIIRNVRALNYLIEDLFDAMRISSGKFQLELGETRIQDVAREALSVIQKSVESKKLRISTDISEAIPAFVADSRRLHQVLINLLNNAVKFTPGGGAIALRIRRRNHYVECIVSDTGKGIERKFLPLVFERFEQEKRRTKMHAAGLGLGLAIVREIVELHGGSIEVCSEGADKGSTFTVRLPMRRKHRSDASLHPPANESQPTGSEKRFQKIRSNSDSRRSL